MNIEGLVIFTIGQIANHLGIKEKIIDFLQAQGFYILLQAEILIAFDFLPVLPTPGQKLQYSHLDNARILAKYKILNYFGEDTDSDLLISTDNSAQAWKLLNKVLPEQIKHIQKQIEILSQSFTTRQPIKRIITKGHGRRSKSELIEYKGNLAIKKTFKPGAERFWKRELFVRKEFSNLRPEIPPLLDYGDSYIICPYYQDMLLFTSKSNIKISLEIARQAMEVLYFFYERGYALIDFHPGNLIIDEKTGLKMVDFEFLYSYQVKPPLFIDCYDLAGVPSDFTGDRPIGALKNPQMFLMRNYRKDWQPYTGIELEELIYSI